MPHRCDPCDRSFAHKEALQAHLKSSSLEHPFCSICDRRFNCQSARDMHMANKHPPTYDCESCNRTFKSPAALQSHYRGHASHPNCARCGRGFKDHAERDEHQRPCDLCTGVMLCEDTLKTHYRQSSNHPDCTQCEQGFRDESALTEHVSAEHPPVPEPQPQPQPESEVVVAAVEPQIQEIPEAIPTPPEPPLQTLAAFSPPLSQVYATTTTPLSSPPMPPRSEAATSPRLNSAFPSMVPPSLRAHIDVLSNMRQDTSSPALILPKKYAAQIKDEQTPLFSPLSALPHPESVPPGAWQNIQGTSTRRLSTELAGTSLNSFLPNSIQRPGGQRLSDGALQLRPSSWRRPLPSTPNEPPFGRPNDLVSSTQTSPPRNLWAERNAMQAASLSGSSWPVHSTIPSGIPVASRNVTIPTSSFPGYGTNSYSELARNRGYSLPRSTLVPTMEENATNTGSTTPSGVVTTLPTWRERMATRRPLKEGGDGGNISGGMDVNGVTNRLLAPAMPSRAGSGSSVGVAENPWNIRPPASPPSAHPPVPWKVQLPSSHGSISPDLQSPEVFSPFDLPALPPPPPVPGMSPIVTSPVYPDPDSSVHIGLGYTTNNSQHEAASSSLLKDEPIPRLVDDSHDDAGKWMPTGQSFPPPPFYQTQTRSQSRSPPRMGRDTPIYANTHLDTSTADTNSPTQSQTTINQIRVADGEKHPESTETTASNQGHVRAVSLSSPRTSTHSASASVLDSLESVPTSFENMMDSDDPESWEHEIEDRRPTYERVNTRSRSPRLAHDLADAMTGSGFGPIANSPPVPMAAFYTPESASAAGSPIPEPALPGQSQVIDLSESVAQIKEIDANAVATARGPAQENPTTEPSPRPGSKAGSRSSSRPPVPTRTSTLTLTPPRPSLQIHSPKEPTTAISERHPANTSILMTPAETFASPRVHCRVCKSDPCIEMTATMCGHVFCYRCITKHVMEKSECPVCQTPTLLYCLFRLHLYS